jgi:hypothetical protein
VQFSFFFIQMFAVTAGKKENNNVGDFLKNTRGGRICIDKDVRTWSSRKPKIINFSKRSNRLYTKIDLTYTHGLPYIRYYNICICCERVKCLAHCIYTHSSLPLVADTALTRIYSLLDIRIRIF